MMIMVDGDVAGRNPGLLAEAAFLMDTGQWNWNIPKQSPGSRWW